MDMLQNYVLWIANYSSVINIYNDGGVSSEAPFLFTELMVISVFYSKIKFLYEPNYSSLDSGQANAPGDTPLLLRKKRQEGELRLVNWIAPLASLWTSSFDYLF